MLQSVAVMMRRRVHSTFRLQSCRDETPVNLWAHIRSDSTRVSTAD
jgi:hypothetical protein